jgi:NodT family efflux transporter outer membrane factor (OMF) lipoprotein
LSQNRPREANKAVPAAFSAAQHASSTSPASPAAATADSSARKSWREYFDDPDLKALVGVALTGNKELNIRLQEIIIAKSEVMSRQGEYLPRLAVGVGAGIDKVGKYTSQGVSDEAHGVGNPLEDYRVGFTASWEVDIWKRLRNSAQAAAYRYLASIEGRNFALTQLVAEIANSYYELLVLDRQLEVLNRNIAIQQNGLDVVRLQKQAARVTELAVQRFEAEVFKNQSRRFTLEQQRIEAENRINFLVGRFPQSVVRDARRLDAPLPSAIHAGVPAQLLDNRPDVRSAELELSAAKLDVKAARAAFFPALSIDAGVGYNAFNLKHLFTTPESLIYNAAGNLVAPLLNRRAIEAQYYSANAEQLRAVFHYERTLLTAFTEVANQLAMLGNLQNSYDLQSQQVDRLTQSIQVSNVLFQSARADYMEVLLTRRDSLDAEMELFETKARQLHAMVNLYQALGGGWR